MFSSIVFLLSFFYGAKLLIKQQKTNDITLSAIAPNIAPGIWLLNVTLWFGINLYKNKNITNVTKINKVESDCPITFTIRCEFNTIGMFDLSVPNPGPFRHIESSQSAVSMPIFSDVFNENDFPLLYGWKIHAKPIVKMDWGEDELYIGNTLGTTLNMMIDYHLEHHLDVELFLTVKLRENRCLIDDGYYIDWKRRMLVFTNINYAHTYRLIIAVNKLYINDLLKDMYGKTD